MSQLGIVARIALIVTIALVLGQIAVVASYMWQDERSPPPPYAIAQRIVSTVELLDATPPDLTARVLSVANARGFAVSVLPGVPETFQDDMSFTRLRVLAQSVMQTYAPERNVRAGVLDTRPGSGDGGAITLVTELKNGSVATFTVSDNVTLRIWNMPIGFIAGLFGVAVAFLAIVAVARETRPLAKLAESIEELGNRVEPIEVKEQGARELRTLIRAINQMQDRILALIGNRTLFLGAISHDIKTYLTRFRLRLEMMPGGTHRDRAVRDVEAMEHLLNDVLSFARDTSGQAQAETADLDDTLRQCAAAADPRGDLITLSIAPVELSVRVPKTALRRVIDNLLSNALRCGEHATITSERRQTLACFVIEDDGPGMDAADLALAFDPFFRGEPSRNRQFGGTGLGLSIVKQILDAHGGTIQLENRQGMSGLRATVCLPLADTASSSPAVTDCNRTE